MRELALRQAPGRPEVLRQALLLLHSSSDSGINSLLVRGLALGERLLRFGLAVCKELLLSRGLALGRSLGKV